MLILTVFLFFLNRLYRSLGDYDVVRGIFSGKIGTKPITRTALQAEAKSDYAEAVKLYNEVTYLSACPHQKFYTMTFLPLESSLR